MKGITSLLKLGFPSKCFSEYEQNVLMSKYKNNLESFMKLKNIRYPADFPV